MTVVHRLMIAAVASVAALLMAGCGGGRVGVSEGCVGDTLTHHASLLTLVDCGDRMVAEIADPWHGGATLHRYVLVGRDADVAADVAAGAEVVRVPLQRSVVYSAVHTAAIAEIGAVNAIAGVADAMYFAAGDTVAALVKSGRIADIGSSMQPSVERVIDIDADAVLLSPYENTGHGVIASAGVPIIDMADYMENTPQGRAEWLLLLGELYGCREEAKAIYDKVVADYTALKAKAAAAAAGARRPQVLMEMPQRGVWYAPAGDSFMSHMISDAGGVNPWADTDGSGSVQLDVPAVIDRAEEADVWLVRTFGYDVTLPLLADASTPVTRIRAYQTGNVYGCNTAASAIFNDIAFHPERVLADFVAIFHPQVMPGYTLRYYRKAQ
ncbi:MAG: ABC transporter substrate-binding protein [Muribaculaceae bacterium]